MFNSMFNVVIDVLIIVDTGLQSVFTGNCIYLIVCLFIHCFSGKWTQLQIIFDAVDIVNEATAKKYPMGVKVSHRAYAEDNVKLLRK